MPSKSYRCDLLMLTVVIIWGLNFAVVKSIYTDFNPLAFNALRLAVATATMVVVLKLRGDSLRVDREDLPSIFGLALISNTAYQFLFIIGLANTRAGNAGLLMAMTPVFAYMIGVLGKREMFSVGVLSGIVLSLAGVAAIVTSGDSGVSFGQTGKGDLMVMGAAFCWGFYSGASSRLLAKYGPLRLTVLSMTMGTSVLVALSIPWVIRQNWWSISAPAWSGFFYSAFLAIVYSYVVWAYALSRIGVAHTAIFSNITPIVAMLGGWWLLGETPSFMQLAGVVCVLTGVFFVRSHKPSVELD